MSHDIARHTSSILVLIVYSVPTILAPATTYVCYYTKVAADVWTSQPPVDFDGRNARPVVDDSYLSSRRSILDPPDPLGFRPTDAGTALSGNRRISAGNRWLPTRTYLKRQRFNIPGGYAARPARFCRLLRTIGVSRQASLGLN